MGLSSSMVVQSWINLLGASNSDPGLHIRYSLFKAFLYTAREDGFSDPAVERGSRMPPGHSIFSSKPGVKVPWPTCDDMG